MSKKIDTVFNADPNAGNDPSKTASIAVDFGTSTEEAYSLEQISSVVANRLGISENLPDQATFSARFPDNSLIATVDPIQTAYEYYVINTTGITPSSGGTTGALAFTAADWDSHAYYLFISDDDSTYAQVEPLENDVNNDGLDPPGLILQSKYTLAPPAITDLVVTVGANGSGEMQLDFTLPTVVDGINSIIAYFMRTDTNTQVATSVGITTGTTVSNLPNDVEMQVSVVITANNRLPSISNIETDTIPVDTDAAYDGEIYIVSSDVATINDPERYQKDEGVTIPITFGVRNSISNADVRFTARLVDDTALDGVNYTAWADPLTVNITGVSGGAGTVDVNILTTDADAGTNLCLQVHIIPDSVDVGVGNGTASIAAYPDNAELVYINGTGGADSNVYAIDTGLYDGVTTTTGFVFDAVNFTGEDDQGQTGDDLPAIIPKATVNASLPNIETNNEDYLHVPQAGRSYVYETDPALSYIAVAPRRDYVLNFGSETGQYYLLARSYTNQTWYNKFWPGMDGNASFSNGESGTVKPSGNTNDDWVWAPCKDASNNVVTITINAEDEHIFNYWPNQNYCSIDRWALVKNVAFDPNLQTTASGLGDDGDSTGSPESWGQAENAKEAGGTVVDDTANLQAPTNPLPPTNNLVPTINIVDGDIGVGLNSTIILTWETGANTIQVDASNFIETDAADNVITGSYTVFDNILTWTPSTSRAEATDYTFAVSGTIIDAAGAVRTFDINKDDVTFTTFNSGDAGILVNMNTNDWPINYNLTKADMLTWLGTDGTANTEDSLVNGGIRNVLDPFGTGRRVWKVRFSKDSTGTLNCGFQFDLNITEVDELFISFEMALPANWISPLSLHMSQATSNPYKASSVVLADNWSFTQQLIGNNSYLATLWSPHPYPDTKDDTCCSYSYQQASVQKLWWANTADPAEVWGLPKESQVQWEREKYSLVETRLNLNTLVGSVAQADGDMQMWHNSQLAVDRQDITIRGDNATGKIGRVSFRIWTGGPAGDPQYAHAQEQFCYIAGFTVSTSPITH